MNAKAIASRVLVIFAALLLAAGAVALSFFPTARYSATENRLLAAAPQFSQSALRDGAYTAAWDTFATERFPARGAMRKARALFSLSLGEREVHGVILCRDGSLSRRIQTDGRAFSQNLGALARLAERFSQIGLLPTVAIAPCRIEARAEVLPRLYDTGGEQENWKTLAAYHPRALALTDCTDDTLWYRTDHHWSTHGAYVAYCRIAESMGLVPFDDFTHQVVSTDFYGTSDAAAGIPLIAPDSITLYRYEGDTQYLVTRDGAPADFSGLYDLEKLQTRDQYAVFLGGNCGVLTVEKGDEDPRPTLLLIRDSFADSVIPFLARHFRMIAIDPRYAAVSLSTLAAEVDEVLVLCGMQSICNTLFFPSLLRA